MENYSINPFKLDPGLMEFDDYRDECGFYSFEKECDVKWSRLSNIEKENIFRYLKLTKRFKKNPDLVKASHRKWMLENCNIPTELVPDELMTENDLWL